MGNPSPVGERPPTSASAGEGSKVKAVRRPLTGRASRVGLSRASAGEAIRPLRGPREALPASAFARHLERAALLGFRCDRRPSSPRRFEATLR